MAAETTEANTEEAVKKDGEETKPVDESVLNAVVERLHFFFSDANIRQDKFIRQLLMGDDHAVPVESLLKFNTILKHTSDPNVVVQAAKSERLQDRLLVTQDSTAIKLIEPFTKSRMSENIPLTLVLDNLPVKTNEEGKSLYSVAMEDLKPLFQQYGEVALIKLRFGFKDSDHNDGDGSQKKPRVPLGSAFVEFADEDTMNAAAADVLTSKDSEEAEPKRKLEVGGNTLSVVSMKDWLDSNKKRKSVDGDKDESPSKRKADDEDEPENTFTLEWKSGCVIKLQGLGESCDREALLEAVCQCLGKELDDVKALKIYVDFSRGQSHGAIRFQEPEDGVKTVVEKLKAGEVKIADQAVENPTILEGEEEKKYWDDFIAFKNKQLQQKRSNNGNRRKKRFRRN